MPALATQTIHRWRALALVSLVARLATAVANELWVVSPVAAVERPVVGRVARGAIKSSNGSASRQVGIRTVVGVWLPVRIIQAESTWPNIAHLLH